MLASLYRDVSFRDDSDSGFSIAAREDGNSFSVGEDEPWVAHRWVSKGGSTCIRETPVPVTLPSVRARSPTNQVEPG